MHNRNTRRIGLLALLIGIGAVVILAGLFWRGRVSSELPASTPGTTSKETPALVATGGDVSTNTPAQSTQAVAMGTHAGIYYVSPDGDGMDGRSWATAWKTPSRIDWKVIQPGDTIVLDGGQKSVTYRGGIDLSRNGAEGKPITLTVSNEAGHNGQVVLFGGRSTPLPYCGQASYTRQDADLIGIDVAANWIVIDGGKWRGIIIHGFNQDGVMLEGDTDHVTLRNLEIYDNGTMRNTTDGWRSDEKGISLAGYNHIFDRLIVHDNGQDEIQSGGKIGNFTLSESWLYNSRPHPDDPSRSFNSCTHSDGIQLWTGGDESGVTVDQSMLGPGLMHGLLLGEGSTKTVVNDVVIRDSLFIGASNASIHTQNSEPQNWLLERVTSIRPVDQKNQNVFYTGTGLTIRDSLFIGGVSMYVPKDGDYSNNCQWDVSGTKVGDKVDPQLANPTDSLDITRLVGGNYKPGVAACVGSHVTSAQQLMR